LYIAVSSHRHSAEDPEMQTLKGMLCATVMMLSFIPVANAERVCRQVCLGPVCEERCTETQGRLDRRDERRFEERREELREERREREPKLDIIAPGVVATPPHS
jgi:hypothetical protein